MTQLHPDDMTPADREAFFGLLTKGVIEVVRRRLEREDAGTAAPGRECRTATTRAISKVRTARLLGTAITKTLHGHPSMGAGAVRSVQREM